jgi:hypothetical protein
MDIISEVRGLLNLSEHYASEVEKNIADRKNDIRAMCFWNLRNRIMITEEILNFYDRSWRGMDVSINDEGLGNEMMERIVTVTKNLFVDVVSTVEKTSKEAVTIYSLEKLKDISMKNSNYMYMRNILSASQELGLIDKAAMEEWDDIMVMRNLVAHNNSMSDRSKKFTISDITISMRPGRMMKGPLNTFLVLSERTITLFYEWLNSIDSSKD